MEKIKKQIDEMAEYLQLTDRTNYYATELLMHGNKSTIALHDVLYKLMTKVRKLEENK
jgi:hypothetical protein